MIQNTGTIIVEEPGVVIYHPGVTVELTCDISPGVAWVVNNNSYLRNELRRGDVPGHNASGINILILNNPLNNSQYACSDSDNEGRVYTILVAGEYAGLFVFIHVGHVHIFGCEKSYVLCIYMHVCSYNYRDHHSYVHIVWLSYSYTVNNIRKF